MLRNLNQQFRGNVLPEELHSGLVGNGAVPPMKNACGPPPCDVKTGAIPDFCPLCRNYPFREMCSAYR
jgi:hypothetical protein